MRKSIFRLLFSLSLAAASQLPAAEESIEITDADSGEPRSVPRLDTEQLDELLGPIALYPDSLLALVLPAATMPTDLVLASRYLQAGGDTDRVDEQPWDESVRSLARYPEVVRWMDEKLSWSIMVGDAFLAQPVEVMQSIQRLRARARTSGALASTSEQRVIEEEGHLRIVPSRPEVIYVPVYDPLVVYAPPRTVWVAGWGAGPIVYRWCYPTGIWLSYDCDWSNHRVWIVNSHWRSRWYHQRDCWRPYAYRRHHYYENRDIGCGWKPRREHRRECRDRGGYVREHRPDRPGVDRDGGRWERGEPDRRHRLDSERRHERSPGEPVRRRDTALHDGREGTRPGAREHSAPEPRKVEPSQERATRSGFRPTSARVRGEVCQDEAPSPRVGLKPRVQPRSEPSPMREGVANQPPVPPRAERGGSSVRTSERREAPAVERSSQSRTHERQVRPPRGETARRIRSGDTERRRAARSNDSEG